MQYQFCFAYPKSILANPGSIPECPKCFSGNLQSIFRFYQSIFGFTQSILRYVQLTFAFTQSIWMYAQSIFGHSQSIFVNPNSIPEFTQSIQGNTLSPIAETNHRLEQADSLRISGFFKHTALSRLTASTALYKKGTSRFYVGNWEGVSRGLLRVPSCHFVDRLLRFCTRRSTKSH